MLMRNKIQLDFRGGWVIRWGVFPLLDRQRCRIYQDRIASDGRDLTHRPSRINRDEQAYNSANLVLLQFRWILRRHFVDQLAQCRSILSPKIRLTGERKTSANMPTPEQAWHARINFPAFGSTT